MLACFNVTSFCLSANNISIRVRICLFIINIDGVSPVVLCGQFR